MLYSLLKSFLNKSSQKSTLFDDLITQSTTAPMNDPTRPGDVDLLLEELRMASEIVEQHRLASNGRILGAATNGVWVE